MRKNSIDVSKKLLRVLTRQSCILQKTFYMQQCPQLPPELKQTHKNVSVQAVSLACSDISFLLFVVLFFFVGSTRLAMRKILFLQFSFHLIKYTSSLFIYWNSLTVSLNVKHGIQRLLLFTQMIILNIQNMFKSKLFDKKPSQWTFIKKHCTRSRLLIDFNAFSKTLHSMIYWKKTWSLLWEGELIGYTFDQMPLKFFLHCFYLISTEGIKSSRKFSPLKVSG